MAADYFPEAIQIVDWRHAVGHRETVVADFLGGATESGSAWRAARKATLWEGEAAAVAAAIRVLPVPPRESAAQTETRRREAEYFENHRERLRYRWFREQGYQIGTGLMEASCRTVMNHCFDQSRMSQIPKTFGALAAGDGGESGGAPGEPTLLQPPGSSLPLHGDPLKLPRT